MENNTLHLGNTAAFRFIFALLYTLGSLIRYSSPTSRVEVPIRTVTVDCGHFAVAFHTFGALLCLLGRFTGLIQANTNGVRREDYHGLESAIIFRLT